MANGWNLEGMIKSAALDPLARDAVLAAHALTNYRASQRECKGSGYGQTATG